MTFLTEPELDQAILRELFPEEQKTEIQLSVEIDRSGGAITTGFRCLDLEKRGLVYCSYRVRGGECSYWRLTVRGKWEVQKLIGEVATAGGPCRSTT